MKRTTLSLLMMIYCQLLFAQGTISSFTWNSGAAINPASGPTPISISPVAVTQAGGVGGTFGLNPGLPKQDLNITLSGTAFDVGGLDVSLDFQRDEGTAYFLTRGAYFNFGINGGGLFVTFRVDNGTGSYNTVSSGSIYTVPNDDVFRTYRFIYVPLTGIAELRVDNAIVWSNNGPDNRNMYWTGAGDVVIGELMDGTGSNVVILDNFNISSVTVSPLPIELTEFNMIEATLKWVELFWQTLSETNNDFFTVERSENGIDWHVVGTVDGAGNNNTELNYHYTDISPIKGVSYYRLKQTDFNGECTYSQTIAVNIISNEFTAEIYPNPAQSFVTFNVGSVEQFDYEIYELSGKLMKVRSSHSGARETIDVSAYPDGIYFVKLYCGEFMSCQKLVVKRD